MITVAITEDRKIIESILSDPELFKLYSGGIIELKDLVIDHSFQYLLIKNGKDVLGCFQIKRMTNTILEVHAFILPKYWGNPLVKVGVDSAHLWIKKQGYLKTFTQVPSNCTHVLKFLQKINYHCCGMIEKGIIHNHLLATLFFYEFEV